MSCSVRAWRIGAERAVALDQPALMGILNITPDSFSDGGLHLDPGAAVDAAHRMIEEGASIIDIGGESTRPGAQRISADEQLRRVIPVIERLRTASNVSISIDTTRAEVARAALDAGANIINDVAAGLDDPGIIELAAQRDCGLILMHRLRPPERDSYSTQYDRASTPQYDDVIAEIASFLDERAEAAIRAGVDPASIVIDPGLGFGKTVAQNYEIIAQLDSFAQQHPVLFAASRKSFLAADRNTEPRDRLAASIAVAVAAFFRGVRIFRVHDVAAHRDALAAASRIEALRSQAGATASDRRESAVEDATHSE